MRAHEPLQFRGTSGVGTLFWASQKDDTPDDKEEGTMGHARAALFDDVIFEIEALDIQNGKGGEENPYRVLEKTVLTQGGSKK